MGKFIEVSLYRSKNNARKMININEIISVTPDSSNRAYIDVKGNEELVTNHTYDEVRDALFMVGDKAPVISVSIGTLKDEK